jgi:hypothetical protein
VTAAAYRTRVRPGKGHERVTDAAAAVAWLGAWASPGNGAPLEPGLPAFRQKGPGRMDRRRPAALAMILALLVIGCGQASPQLPAADEHRFTHVHEFPDMGLRIAPPTGTPRLRWQQALQAATRRNDGWESRTPPQVKLADYSSRSQR